MSFIDTAEGYETSESVLGKALKGQRDQVFLATKLSGQDHSMEHMKRAIENSLRSLDTDYIDLYQLHSPQQHWPIEQTMEGLLRLRDEGKIRYIGISNFSAKQTEDSISCLAIAHIRRREFTDSDLVDQFTKKVLQVKIVSVFKCRLVIKKVWFFLILWNKNLRVRTKHRVKC